MCRRTLLRLSFAFLLLACAFSCGDSGSTPSPLPKPPSKLTEPASDAVAIRKVFQQYAEAVRNKDGDQAITCLNQKTLDWHDCLRRDAIQLPASELESVNLHRRLSILQVRHMFPRKKLTESKGEHLLAEAVCQGSLGKMPDNLRLKYVGSNGKTAYATTRQSGDRPTFFFENEADGWKLDLTKVHEFVEQQLTAQWKRHEAAGMTEREFLFQMLEAGTGREVDERILHGPLASIPE